MYDMIVVGARCAGSPTAMLLARKGYRVLLVDKATFPSDIINGHFLHARGVACLKRWGILDRVIASKCPAITSVTLDVGPFSLVGPVSPSDGVAALYAPRRIVLDHILVNAAVEAGVELREGFQVQELLREGERVRGSIWPFNARVTRSAEPSTGALRTADKNRLLPRLSLPLLPHRPQSSCQSIPGDNPFFGNLHVQKLDAHPATRGKPKEEEAKNVE